MIFYFNECLWIFQDCYLAQYILAWYAPINHEQCIFIKNGSADKKKTINSSQQQWRWNKQKWGQRRSGNMICNKTPENDGFASESYKSF